MTREDEVLVEEATTAWRPRGVDGSVRGHPAWHDLDAEGREAVFEATVQARALEAAADPGGLSSTGRAVMARILGAGR
jgi:hypothetical protein